MGTAEGLFLPAILAKTGEWSFFGIKMRFSFADHVRAKLHYYLQDLNPLAALLCFVFFAALFFGVISLRTRRRPGRRDCIYGLILCLYAAAVVSVTLLGRSSGGRTQEGVFASFRLLLSGVENSIVDTLLNVFLFIPLGILLMFRLRVPWTCLLILAATLTIEMAQLLTGRGMFEASDIAANCLGGGIGIGLYFAGRAIWKSIQRKKESMVLASETNETEQGDR